MPAQGEDSKQDQAVEENSEQQEGRILKERLGADALQEGDRDTEK